jgi:hypothetical protein
MLAGALLAFALVPNLVGAQTAEEDDPATTEQTRQGHPGHGRHLGASEALDVTAELTGTTSEDVTAALQEGASLASYAADYGVSRDELVRAIVSAMQANLDERVADGSITQERADELAAEMDAKVEQMVDREGLAERGGPGGCNHDDSGEETATDSI